MRERKRLLLLAATTGYQTRVFAERARALGYELVLATDRCHSLDDPWGDHAIPVHFHVPEEALPHIEAAGPFDAVLAVGDRPTLAAALAAERLGVPYHPPAAVTACRDKFLARKRYEAAGLPVPAYFRVAVEDSPGEAARRAPYPCVLKPPGLSGSRGVIRADNQPQFLEAFRRITALLDSADVRVMREERNRYIQVESYIPGREYAIEGVVTGGRLHALARFDKPDPLEGPFFEETIYITPSREPREVQEALIAAAGRAVRALGLAHGPVHAEMRYNDGGVWMLEVAARPIGGLCAKALRFNGGMPLEELLLRHAVGEDVSDARLDGPASGVMMIPIPREGVYEVVTGVEEAAAVSDIEEVLITAKPGQRIVPLPEGSSYLGFIFARGDSPEVVERALRAAHAELRFEIAGTLRVVQTLARGGT